MRVFKFFWKYWKAFGQKVASVNAYILYGLFYIILMSIPGLISRLFFDPLNIKQNRFDKSNFINWQRKKDTLEQARMPF